jgi:hypothetical protein
METGAQSLKHPMPRVPKATEFAAGDLNSVVASGLPSGDETDNELLDMMRAVDN